MGFTGYFTYRRRCLVRKGNQNDKQLRVKPGKSDECMEYGHNEITPEMIVDGLRELSFWHDPIQFTIILKYIKDRFPVNRNQAELEKELREKLRVAQTAGIVTGDKFDRWRICTGLERLRHVPDTLLTLFWQIHCDVINPLADKIKRKPRPVIVIENQQDSDSDSLPSDG